VKLQRNFRNLLARRAAAQAQRLLVDTPLLWRLSALCARAEARAASRIQRSWRARHNIQGFRTRIALKRIEHGTMHHRANRAAKELEKARQAEIAAVRAATKLQAGIRRKIARRRADEAARSQALGLLRQQWGANLEARALGANLALASLSHDARATPDPSAVSNKSHASTQVGCREHG
jgi:hypothetical protein